MLFNVLMIGLFMLLIIIINYLIIIRSWRSFIADFRRRNIAYQEKHIALSQEVTDDENGDR